jgi:hypothetical protein
MPLLAVTWRFSYLYYKNGHSIKITILYSYLLLFLLSYSPNSSSRPFLCFIFLLFSTPSSSSSFPLSFSSPSPFPFFLSSLFFVFFLSFSFLPLLLLPSFLHSILLFTLFSSPFFSPHSSWLFSFSSSPVYLSHSFYFSILFSPSSPLPSLLPLIFLNLLLHCVSYILPSLHFPLFPFFFTFSILLYLLFFLLFPFYSTARSAEFSFLSTRNSFPGVKTAGAWSWLLTVIWCRDQEWMELYLHPQYAFMA